jgi:hypothetical protein
MKRARKLKARTALLAVMLLVVSPMHAWAQATYDRGANQSVMERPHPEYDPLGLRFGGFDARPSLDIGLEHTDNLFADATNEQDDTIAVIRPRLEVASHWSRHSIVADVQAEQTLHDRFVKDDSLNIEAGANARLDVRRSTQIGITGRIAERVEARSAPDSPANAVSPIEYEVRSSSVYLQQAFNRLRVSVSAGQSSFDYEDGVTGAGLIIEQDDRDHDETYVSGRLDFALTPRIALMGEAVVNDREYDLRFPVVPWNRNSEGRTYLAGANFDVTRLIRGEIAVGYFEQEWDDNSVPAQEGVAVRTNIDWFPTELTTVNLTAQRRNEDSGQAFAVSFLQENASVRVDHELRRNVVLTAAVDGERREYTGIARKDEVMGGTLSLRYLMNRRVVIGAGYRYEEQNSTGLNADEDYEQNRFFASVGLRY